MNPGTLEKKTDQYYITETGACHPTVSTAMLQCDMHHHYYHYQSSAQYLWLAATCVVLGQKQEAAIAYDKAIFQDHFNAEALEGKKMATGCGLQVAGAPSYDKHPILDKEFCASVGELPSPYTALHDEAVQAYLAEDYKHALSLLAGNTEHSNSLFLAGKCHFMRKEYEKSLGYFTEAIRISHVSHDAYHRLASNEHYRWGQQLLAAGKIDLAIADFTKALDLYRYNHDARKARAGAYAAKGNMNLAREDGFE